MISIPFLKEIKFFDEKVFLYCEEAILSRQVELAGKKMYYLATAQAVHRHIKSEKSDPVKRFKAWGNSRCYFIDRYSNYHWFGKLVAKLSMKLYVLTFTIYNKLICYSATGSTIVITSIFTRNISNNKHICRYSSYLPISAFSPISL